MALHRAHADVQCRGDGLRAQRPRQSLLTGNQKAAGTWADPVAVIGGTIGSPFSLAANERPRAPLSSSARLARSTVSSSRLRGRLRPDAHAHRKEKTGPLRNVNSKLLMHDFRRTAVRNLERAGVPRSVAMKLTGHKTESIYRRYAIVSEADLAAGVDRLAALHGALAKVTRTVVPIEEARRQARTATVQPQSGPSGSSAGEDGSSPSPRTSEVPGVGFEPTRPCGQGILSPSRLPVPPPRPGSHVQRIPGLGEPSGHPNVRIAYRRGPTPRSVTGTGGRGCPACGEARSSPAHSGRQWRAST